MEKVILVAVDTGESKYGVQESLDELEELVKTAGAETVGRIVQKKEAKHPGTYVGKGKIEEIKQFILETNAQGIITDDELAPAQLRNLSEQLEVKIMDRTMIILDIFAQRANTKEGIIQVELAQLQYRMTRLTGLGKSLSRQGGGIGTRGPGEKKLETDRRHIRSTITQLKKELSSIEKHRDLVRAKRKISSIPVIALVGYTNAGKSTLFNKLTDAKVLEENKLFATLDPTTRKLILPSRTEVLVIDTVGFINKLPHNLIKAFRSTLEEAKYADIILHVVDTSNEQHDMQMEVSKNTLAEMGISDVPIITVYNKCDKLETPETNIINNDEDKSLLVSAVTGEGIEDLKEKIEQVLQESRHKLQVIIPYDKGELLNGIRKNGQILIEEYQNEGIYVEAYLDKETESFILHRINN